VRGERQTDVTCGRASERARATARRVGLTGGDGLTARVRGFVGSWVRGFAAGWPGGWPGGGTGGWPGGVVSAVGGGREGGSRGAGERRPRCVRRGARPTNC
jgi:hypothetical protein